MGYGFGTTAEEHREQLIQALHSARWDHDLPQFLAGLNANLLVETAVDELIGAKNERAQLKALQAAVREVVEHVRDEEWWERRAICDNTFHTTRDPRPLSADEERFCPDCFSSWWATDGSLPSDLSYAIEAVARKALMEDKSVS